MCKNKVYRPLNVDLSHHAAAKALAAQQRRTLTAEMELLIEEECKRRGIAVPAENEGGK